MMGGRGASSGISDSGKRYGTEFEKVAQDGNIMFVRHKGGSVTAPMETRPTGRIYATLDKNNDVKHITFYDANGERYKQIDIKGAKHEGKIPHTHLGYEHDEQGSRGPNAKEQKQIDRVLSSWTKKRKKLNL